MRAVVVGAGPAGIRAAAALVSAGVRPTVIDEGATWGGQIYRQPPSGFQRSKSTLYGFEAAKAEAVHAAMAKIRDRVDYLPRSLVWNCEGGTLDVVSDGDARTVPFTHLILATGAADRVVPFPGWLTPGVFSLGGAQVALKFQGCVIGTHVAFIGTGPLLYLVAYQYAKAGARVAAVLDTAPVGAKLAALPGLLSTDPVTLAKGAYYVGWLRSRGIVVRSGARPVRVEGDGHVTGLVWEQHAVEATVPCDAVAFSFGLRSETQLADLAGCCFRFDPLNRAWLPERSPAGRSSVAGVYLAGDGAGIAGADAAETAGERAALGLLEDAGLPFDRARASHLERRLSRIARFRRALERAFPYPADWVDTVSDDLVCCRCEEVTAGTLRDAIAEGGVSEINRLKALTRIGMGRCQGRICGAAAAELLASARGCSLDAVGRLRGQMPVKPLPFAIACDEMPP